MHITFYHYILVKCGRFNSNNRADIRQTVMNTPPTRLAAKKHKMCLIIFRT